MSLPPVELERTVYHADALALLERLPDASYELVYLDPPFPHTGFLIPPSERPGPRNLDTTLHEAMALYAKVFLQVRRVLTPSGNLFIQLEPASHGLTRVLLDVVFGRENFEREIVWIPRAKATGAHQQHETISWYRRGPGNVKNDSRPLTPEEVKERTNRSDDRGPYGLMDLTSPARTDNSFEWRGYLPPVGRGWRFLQERLDQLDAAGEIEHVSGRRMPFQKRYLAELKVPIGSVWTDIAPEALHQKSGLPSTTPLVLAERIIQVGSNQGDRVLDPFCGTGTTLVAAERLNRLWTGGDASPLAVEVTERRLRAECATGPRVRTREDLGRSGVTVHAAGSIAIERLVEELAPSGNSPLQGRYRLGQVLVVEEGREVEFKEVKGSNPVEAIKSKVDQYVVAFLNNGSGGRILWGVADDGRVVGVALDRRQRDEVRRVVTEKLAVIQPPIPVGSYVITCQSVEGCAADEELFVVEVRVPQVAMSTLYFTGSTEAWIKTDGGKLRLGGLQIIDEILRRSRAQPDGRADESVE